MSIPLYIERINSFSPGEIGEAFYAEIGRTITLWGAVDSSLELILKIINKPERDAELYTDKLKTHSLRRDALKRWLQRDPSLAHIRGDGEKILNAMSRIQVDRDFFAHGRVLEFVGTEPPKIKFAKISLSKRKRSEVRSFDLLRLEKLSSDLKKLHFACLALSVGAVGDESMPAAEAYVMAKARFNVDLESLNTFSN